MSPLQPSGVFLPHFDILRVILFLHKREGIGMENMDLGWLIVGAICIIGMIQLVAWVVVVIKHPGDLRLDPFQTGHSSDRGK